MSPESWSGRMGAPALCIILGSAAVSAQEAPSFDCSEAESSAEELVCSDADLARLDRLVADRFAAALEVASGLGSGAETAEQDLRADQRGWIAGRDECWKADDLRACVEAAYLMREGELVARHMLDEPVGVARWHCGGNPANEVVTYFYDTELPSVRIEQGDTIDAGSLVRTGSGSRYEASFGRSIWIKGPTATYRTADPDGVTEECVMVEG